MSKFGRFCFSFKLMESFLYGIEFEWHVLSNKLNDNKDLLIKHMKHL